MLTYVGGRTVCALGLAACLMTAIGSVPVLAADHVGFEQPMIEVIPGQPFSMLALMTQNTTPLRFYSLDFEVSPQAGATGTLMGDEDASDFYAPRDFITQGGGTRGPVSGVRDGTTDANGNLGLVAIAVTADNHNVATAVPGVSDVLAELVFDVSADATGYFTIAVNQSSSNMVSETLAGSESVPFTHDAVTIKIIPEPGSLALLAGATCLLSCRRRFRGS